MRSTSRKPRDLIRTTAAREAFWTNRPLVQRFRAVRRVDSFSLQELISFAKTMPAADFAQCTEGA